MKLPDLADLVPSVRPRWGWMPARVASNFVDSSLLLLAVLERHGIGYVIHYGTLLGAVRLQGVLPWDDDLDIYLLHETTASVKSKIEPDLRAHGMEMVYDPRDFFWVRQRGWLAASGHTGLSLLPPLAESLDRLPAVEAAMVRSELYPLRRYPFYGTEVWGPADPEPILERLYGDKGSPVVMARFRAAPLDRRRQLFWRRPLTDWEAISQRFRRRSWLEQATCWPWWWANGAYLIALNRVRDWARRKLS